MLISSVVNPNPEDHKLRQLLLTIVILLAASPANARDRHLRRLENTHQFVDAWRLEENASPIDPLTTEGFATLSTAWAFVNYDPIENVVVVRPYGQPQKTIRVAVPWTSDSETVYHLLRYFGFRTVFSAADDNRTAELLRPHSQHSTVYISNQDSCSTAPCKTFMVVTMNRWNE